ncbi:hypothetical protein MKW98_011167 [Papaver atlanticum]|uniref:Uncharacterized protein n=1 Tax=Papaver atlanticum TaxID=357466 RepID=A0AAD4XV57_9MAGN|nr:hypothetical protein MKW98_011167 [Papaver atlanticum]
MLQLLSSNIDIGSIAGSFLLVIMHMVYETGINSEVLQVLMVRKVVVGINRLLTPLEGFEWEMMNAVSLFQMVS